MRQTLKLLSAILIIHATLNYSFAQLENLTFEVRASNFVVYDTVTNTDPLISGLMTHFKFEIYIKQVNTPSNDAEIMRFALGQYYWNLNFGAGFPGDTSGFLGYASVTYVPGSTTFSNPNAIPTSPKFMVKNGSSDNCDAQGYPTGTSRSSIRMNSNIALGSSSDVKVSTVYPGTRVGTYIVRKKYTTANPSSYFPSISGHMRWRVQPICSINPDTKLFAYNGLGGLSTEVTTKGTYIMDTLFTSEIIRPPLILKAVPEGLYNHISNRLYKKAEVNIELRQTGSPYTFVDSVTGLLDSINFNGKFIFSALNNGNYYIIVKYKNCLQTWSSYPVNFTYDTVYYDFTTALNTAFGNNQKQVDTSPEIYALISGNVNGDAIIDAADLSAVENDAEDGLTGNLLTDVTGDNFVDAIDISIVENNAFTGAIVITP